MGRCGTEGVAWLPSPCERSLWWGWGGSICRDPGSTFDELELIATPAVTDCPEHVLTSIHLHIGVGGGDRIRSNSVGATSRIVVVKRWQRSANVGLATAHRKAHKVCPYRERLFLTQAKY